MSNAVNSMISRRQAIAGLAAAGAMLPTFRLTAQERHALSSAWAPSSYSSVRLIAGGPVEGKPGYHQAGIEMKLAPDFKTYWRHPGDSGVPP
eukprot:gene6565-8721_t